MCKNYGNLLQVNKRNDRPSFLTKIVFIRLYLKYIIKKKRLDREERALESVTSSSRFPFEHVKTLTQISLVIAIQTSQNQPHDTCAIEIHTCR